MATDIGPTLREARMRRQIHLDEVEESTKIRARYLRALENEEWDVLPGGPYTRSFIRTYANFLGLDGERLADEFRYEAEPGEEERQALAKEATMRTGVPAGSERSRIGRGTVAVLITVGLIGVLVVLGLTSGSNNENPETTPLARHHKGKKHHKKHKPKAAAGVSLKLTAIADVWVCLENAKGTALVNGEILPAGADSGPFHSGRFDVRFGNGSVALKVNGKDTSIPSSGSPVGYEVTAKGPRPLPQSQQPTCA